MSDAPPIAMGAPLSLRQRVFRAGQWTLGGHVLGQVIRLGGNLVLTRLLVPEAFGLMAIVYVVMIGFTLFSDLGISQSIVQNPRGEESSFLDTAWTVQILRGLMIFILACVASALLPVVAAWGWVADGTVYADPQLPWVIAVFSLSAAIAGFESTKLATARRHMWVRPVAQIELVSQVTALIAMIALAWWLRSIWSLVAGGIVAALVRTAMSHAALPGHGNRIAWDRASLAELIGFGKWVFMSSIVGFLVINGDRLLLGGMIPAQTLGMYAIAFLLVNALALVVSTITGNVVFPALSQVVREQPEELSAKVNKFQIVTDLFLLGSAGFLIIAGQAVVDMLYDERYQDAGTMLCILGVGAIGLRYQVVDTAFVALGRPAITTYCHTMRWLVLYVGVPVAFAQTGFTGALWMIVASQFAAWPISLYYKWRFTLTNLKVELFGVVPLIAGLAAGGAFRAVAPSRAALRALF